MKKLGLITSILVFISVFGNTIVIAESDYYDSDFLDYNLITNIPDEYKRTIPLAGITPDSWIYGFKRLSENIDIFFTFGELKKAEKYVDYAEIRLSEVKEMSEKGNNKIIQELLNEYEINLKNSNSILEEAKKNGKNISELTEYIAISTTIHIDLMEDILEVAPNTITPIIRSAMNYSYDSGEDTLELLEEIRPIKAAEINAILAEKYILKAIEKVQENDSEDFSKLILGYEEKINKSKSILNEVEEYLGKNITDVEQLIYDVIENHDVIISEICEKVSNEKNSDILNLINSTINLDNDFIKDVEGIIISENLTIKEKINKVYESFIKS